MTGKHIDDLIEVIYDSLSESDVSPDQMDEIERLMEYLKTNVDDVLDECYSGGSKFKINSDIDEELF